MSHGADVIATEVYRLVHGMLLTENSWSHAIVTSYNALRHECEVTLMPSKRQTGPIPCVGRIVQSYQPGENVLVALDRDIPMAIIGPLADDTRPPQSSPTIEDDLWVSGSARVDNLEMARYFALPVVAPMWRGKTIIVGPTQDATSGTADQIYTCLQDASGTLYWKPLS